MAISRIPVHKDGCKTRPGAPDFMNEPCLPECRSILALSNTAHAMHKSVSRLCLS